MSLLFYKQHDSMQCGVTCLQMICKDSVLTTVRVAKTPITKLLKPQQYYVSQDSVLATVRVAKTPITKNGQTSSF